LIGIVMIGTPVWIPAMKLKFDGKPADSTVAVTVTPPAVTWAGSATSAPVGDPTTVKTPVVSSSTSPTCRLLFPVAVVVVPIVMLPCVEFDARQSANVVTPPSVASIAGSSTGQRKNGVQSPGPAWKIMSAPVVVPAEFVATAWKW
jgi:hypothetical protein